LPSIDGTGAHDKESNQQAWRGLFLQGDMIKVQNMLLIYEADGQETKVPMPVLTVASHWNKSSLVVLEIDGDKWTVDAADLHAAIVNATNRGHR